MDWNWSMQARRIKQHIPIHMRTHTQPPTHCGNQSGHGMEQHNCDLDIVGSHPGKPTPWPYTVTENSIKHNLHLPALPWEKYWNADMAWSRKESICKILTVIERKTIWEYSTFYFVNPPLCVINLSSHPHPLVSRLNHRQLHEGPVLHILFLQEPANEAVELVSVPKVKVVLAIWHDVQACTLDVRRKVESVWERNHGILRPVHNQYWALHLKTEKQRRERGEGRFSRSAQSIKAQTHTLMSTILL